jgi:hypothetical protein
MVRFFWKNENLFLKCKDAKKNMIEAKWGVPSTGFQPSLWFFPAWISSAWFSSTLLKIIGWLEASR